MLDLRSIEFEFLNCIEEEWKNCIEEGYTIEDATSEILTTYEDMLDEKEKVALYMGLGNLQIDLEFIDKRVKTELSKIILSKAAERYFKDIKEVKQLLNSLKKRL